jgi:hypothetical protein
MVSIIELITDRDTGRISIIELQIEHFILFRSPFNGLWRPTFCHVDYVSHWEVITAVIMPAAPRAQILVLANALCAALSFRIRELFNWDSVSVGFLLNPLGTFPQHMFLALPFLS